MASRRSMSRRSNSTPTPRRRMAANAGPAMTNEGATTAAKPSDDGGDFIRTLGVDEETRALEEGDRLAASGDYEGARLNFARAWAVWRLPSILLKLAVAEERCGRFVDALRSYGELRTLTDPASDYVRSVASSESHSAEAIAALRAHADRSLALLVERVARLVVDHPPGAEVSIDGHRVPSVVGEPIWVSAGEHVVSAKLADAIESINVECAAGASEIITVFGGAGRKASLPRS